VLAELISRVLDRGVVVSGDVTISVAGVDLIHLDLNLRLASTETLLRRSQPAKLSPRASSGGATEPTASPGSTESTGPTGPTRPTEPTGKDR
jgi:hypothetical protein